MKFLKRLLPILILLAATQPAVPEVIKIVQGWRYIPVTPETWTKFDQEMQAGKFQDALDVAISMRDGSELNIVNEKNLATAKALRALGYVQAAYRLYVEIVRTSPGSFAANEALLDLSQFVAQGKFDEEAIVDAIGRTAPKEAPEAAIPMISYYANLGFMESGHQKWADDYAAEIGDKNFWSDRVNYNLAIENINSGKLKEAQGIFESIIASEFSTSVLKNSAQLHLSRLLFESSEFTAAEEAYKKIPIGDRNSARVLYERAWNQYRLKDYSLALGLLESLKTPFFDRGMDPEHFILTATILRDLCHYPEVKKANEQFQKVFEKTISHIKKGLPLHEDSMLIKMSIQIEPLRTLADVIDLNRKELEKIRNELNEDAVKSIADQYKKSETILRDRMAPRLALQARKEALRLLEVSDQLKLLEYVSGLDENRIQSIFESRGYKAEKADKFSFNTLFWPVSDPKKPKDPDVNEYWFEELKSLRVLISDRCKPAE